MIEIKTKHFSGEECNIIVNRGHVYVNIPKVMHEKYVDVEEMPTSKTREGQLKVRELKEKVAKGATDMEIALEEINDLKKNGFVILEKKENGNTF